MLKIILLLCIPANILFHEIGHILYYCINKISIQAIVFNKYVFVKNNNKWMHRKLKNQHCAYIVPKLSSKYSFKYYEKHICNDLLAGPFVSFLLLIFYVVIIVENGIMDNLVRVFLIANIIVNISILFSCINDKRGSKGDIKTYMQFKDNHKKMYPYILDYMLFSNCNCINYECIYTVEFDDLNNDEKEDWAFDIISLYLLGNINSVDNIIKEYVSSRIRTYSLNNKQDDLVLHNFILFYEFEKHRDVDIKPFKCYSDLNPMEKIYDMLEIDKKIIEGIRLKSE